MGKKGEKMVHVVTGLEEMEGARRATGISSNEKARGSAGATTVSDPEVRENAVRRRFTAEYKRKVLRGADACRQPGDLGALLRREGLYSSNLTTWRRQADRGTLDALTPKKRGPKGVKPDPSLRRIAELEKENQKLSHTLRQAQIIIEAQKKIAEILQPPLDQKEEKRS